MHKNGYEFNECISRYSIYGGYLKILKWLKHNENVKKVIKFTKFEFKRNLNSSINNVKKKFFKTIKFKTKNNYMKGYNKN